MPTAHRVSGLMLANHTGVRHLFTRSIQQMDQLLRRKAFVGNYMVRRILHCGMAFCKDVHELCLRQAHPR